MRYDLRMETPGCILGAEAFSEKQSWESCIAAGYEAISGWQKGYMAINIAT